MDALPDNDHFHKELGWTEFRRISMLIVPVAATFVYLFHSHLRVSSDGSKVRELYEASSFQPTSWCQLHDFGIASSTVRGAGRGVYMHSDSLRSGMTCCYFDGIDLNWEDIMSSPQLIHSAYTIQKEDGNFRIGHRERLTQCGVTQLINDGAALEVPLLSTFQEAKTAIARYEHQTTALANVVFDPRNPLIARATRDVHAGEELFVTYGAAYWLGQVYRTTQSPMLRMLVVLLQPKYVTETHYTYDPYREEILKNGSQLTEHDASTFIRHVLCVRRHSSMWSKIVGSSGSKTAGASKLSAVDKVAALVRFFTAGKSSLDSQFDFTTCPNCCLIDVI